jgi:hypothetical protein
MSKGIKHIDVGDELTKIEYHGEEAHEIASGEALPEDPTETDLFYKTGDNHLYIAVE